jgi:lysozyme family protein
MKENWDEALAHILKWEGGYVNHPSDPGGMTNLGVTKRVWEEWTGKPATEADMRGLTPAMVAPLYRKRYWDAIRGDDLHSGLDLCVVDCAVNAGPGRAARFLQQSVGATVDGAIGPGTLKAVASQDPKITIAKFCDLREAHYKSLDTFAVFGKGWMRRLDTTEAECLGMA